jgi:hypothetical protein
VKNGLENGLFVREKSETYQAVNGRVKEVKRNQAKTRLRKTWAEKTGSKTPSEWSQTHKTPILCMVPDMEYAEAKRAFETLNRPNSEESEITAAEAWLGEAIWLADLGDKAKRDAAFKAGT